MLSLRHSNQLKLLAIVALLLPWSPAQADTWKFQVRDSGGKAVEDAVILLPGATAPAPADIAVMDQINKTFQPHVLLIRQGQRVSFPNSDHIRHHVYSFSPAKPFEIKLYAGVPEEPVLFDTAGIVVLGCNIHDSMVGYIVVADTALAGKTGPQGQLQLAGNATAPVTAVRIWHPRLTGGPTQMLTVPLPAGDAAGMRNLTLDLMPAPATGTGFGNRLRQYGR